MRRRRVPVPPVESPPAACLDWQQLREIAVAANADPRSVARRLRGERVRGSVGRRIDDAIAARGLTGSPADADGGIVEAASDRLNAMLEELAR
jgi:hypothetical protein